MTLSELHQQFQEQAKQLGDYNIMTKTELANGYCDADDARRVAIELEDKSAAIRYDSIRSQYFAALMLRYWYKIFEWMQNSSSLMLELTDFADWLSHSLYVAFYYRMWRYEYEAEVKEGKFIGWKLDKNGERIPNPYYYLKDENAPDKVINRCCASMRGRRYQFYNKYKRKAGVQTYSIDEMVSEIGDGALEYAGCVEGTDTEINAGLISLISEFIKRDNGLEALIVDGIANFYTCKSVDGAMHFDARKLVKHLNMVDKNYIETFCTVYDIKPQIGERILNELKGLGNPKLYKRITKTLTQIKETPQLLSCLIG